MAKVTTARFAKQRVTLPTINVKEAGYLFTYLSYEDQSNNFVYFDDYKVTYTPTNIVQYNEYYPYGLVTNNSWTKENAVGNNFLGNGGTELNTTTSLYDLEYRNYDPALARMHQVDPMADKYASYTPYNYSFNAPSNFNDVNGADPSPGEKDFVKRQPMGEFFTGNDFSRLFRGGSQTAMFDKGWSPSRNSMSYELFAAADAYFGEKNAENVLKQWAIDKGLALHADGSINRYEEAGWVLDFVKNAELVDEQGNVTGTTPLGYWHMEYREVSIGSIKPSSIGQPGTLESLIPVWGSGRSAVDNFQNGNYWAGAAYTALAVSDVFLLKSLATGAVKLGSAGFAKTFGIGRSQNYGAAVSRWRAAGILPKGYKHHWLITQEMMKANPALKPFGNQLWNLTSFSSQASHMRWAHGTSYGLEGAIPGWQLMYPLSSTPTWLKAGSFSIGGRFVD